MTSTNACEAVLPMIPTCLPNLTGNEAAYLAECISTTFVSSVGPFVTRLEQLVAEAAGSAGAVATASGTCALHAGLLTLGVGRDDLVVAPSFTFIASANAIAHCGAQPWLMDVESERWGMDPAVLEQALATETRTSDGQLIHKASGRRVAAVMPVHAIGLPPRMDAIVALARRHGLPVLADAAAAIGATSQGRLIGQLGADLSMISFNGNKTVTAGGGGALVGDDLALLARARHLTTTARVGGDYDHDMVGYNYRMTNIAAAVGCAQMERLEALVAAKRRIRRTYDAAFADLPGLSPFADDGEGACWFSGVVAQTPERAVALREHLRTARIEARSFWKPVHFQAPYRDAPRSAMPVSEALWSRMVTLPCSTGLTEADQGRVIDAVRAFAAA